jgi:hypothetical protein
VPFTVSVNAAPPAVAAVGARLVVAGNGWSATLIVNACPFDVHPPFAGVITVSVAVPSSSTYAALIAAPSCVAVTNVVARSLPFQRTTD